MATAKEEELIEALRGLLYGQDEVARVRAAKLVATHDMEATKRKESSCYWDLCSKLHTLIDEANNGPKHGWVNTKQIRECMG